MAGKGTGLGIIPIRPGTNDCFFGAIDIDAYTDFEPSGVALMVETLGLPLVVCKSKSGGAHLFLFAKQAVPAEQMITRLREMTAALAYPKVEIFPKQEHLLDQDKGNWINLPLFGNNSRYGVRADNTTMVLEEFLDYADVREQPPEFFTKPVEFKVPPFMGKEPPPRTRPEAKHKRGKAEGNRQDYLKSALGQCIRALYPNVDTEQLLGYAAAIRAGMKPPPEDSEWAEWNVPKIIAWILNREAGKAKERVNDSPVDGFPSGFFLREKGFAEGGGVYLHRGEDDDILVCTPFRTLGHMQDVNSGVWHRLVEVTNRLGKKQEVFLEEGTLFSPSWTVPMREAGLMIHHELHFVDFFKKTNAGAEGKVSDRPGWSGDNFILPERSFGSVGLVRLDAPNLRLEVQGTAEEWRAKVGRYCSGNSRLLFAVSAAFAPVLLHRIDDLGRGVCPGFHFQGPTSKGKTTLLDVAGSVIGGTKNKPYYRSWRTTLVGLEFLAQAHNNLPLMLDEIGQADPKVLGNMLYQIANNEGRGRGTANLKLARTPTWNTLLLSSGERRPEEMIDKARGGQMLRLLTIPAVVSEEWGVFENIHGFDRPEQFANALKQASSACYGAPLRAFLEKLVADLEGNVENFRAKFLALADEWGKGVTGEVPRAASHFAAVAAAGEIATMLGVTGFASGECEAAAKKCFDAWLAARGTSGSSDEDSQLRQIQKFISENSSGKMEDMDEETIYYLKDGTAVDKGRPRLPIHYGFKVLSKDEYWLHVESFKQEACKGYDADAVARMLAKREIILIEGRNNTRKRASRDGTKRFFVVRHSKLFGIEPEPNQKNLKETAAQQGGAEPGSPF